MSALTLERLLFDPAAASDGPSVGSYIQTVDGGVIDSTDVSGVDGLNVNVLNDIAVDLDHTTGDSVQIGDGTEIMLVNANGSINAVVTATDLDIRDLAFATDSVDVSGSEVSLDAATLAALETITVVDGGGSLTVDAVDLDIRNLVFATDSVDVSGSEVSLDAATLAALETITVNQGTSPWVIGDGGGSITVDGAVSIAGGVADDAADSGNPLKVGSRAYAGSSALAALSASGDRADMLSDLYRRIYINDAPNISVTNAAVAVDTTAGGVSLGTAAAGRTRILIQNNGDKSIFVGAGTVTAVNGLEVAKGATLALEAGQALAFKAIAASGTQDVRVLQLA